MSHCEHGIAHCDQCERGRLVLRCLLVGVAVGIVIGLMVWRLSVQLSQ